MKPLYIIRNTTSYFDNNDTNIELLSMVVKEHAMVDCDIVVIDANSQNLNLPCPVINLDPFTRTYMQYSLDICRSFTGDQHHPTGFCSRTNQSISEQIANIPPGSYMVMDDDIASGSTKNFVMSELAKYSHLEILGFVSLLRMWLDDYGYANREVYDCIDTHDFWGNYSTSGLVVNGMREYYWSDNVDLQYRAKFKEQEHAKKILRDHLKGI